MTSKQHQARNKALYEVSRVLTELHKLLPLSEDGKQLKAMPQKYAHSSKGAQLKDKATGKPCVIDDEALLIRLTDICSHTTQGLHFLATSGKSFSCDIFYTAADHSSNIKHVLYNMNTHKTGMMHLESMAHSLKGSGWKNCRKALLILAGLMLIAVGIFAAAHTGGISLTATLGGVAILTAGVGFFIGRDTGVAGAVKGVKMKGMEKQDDDVSPGSKPK